MVLTTVGEVEFVLTPFLDQGTAVVLDAGLVMQQGVALTDSRNKVDPVSFVNLVMPFCFVLTAPLLLLTSWIHPCCCSGQCP